MPDRSVAVSVIIPVYHVASYLPSFLESLSAQQFSSLAFLFIDDGGNDGSMDIVRAFASKDPRAQIIENKGPHGPGQARNVGIEAATGRYLSFLDPDDRIAPDFYQLLYRKAEQSGADIIKGARQRRDLDGKIIPEVVSLNELIAEGLAAERPPLYPFSIRTPVRALQAGAVRGRECPLRKCPARAGCRLSFTRLLSGAFHRD